jgi:transcriptional regulator with XRE-family HTH domain
MTPKKKPRGRRPSEVFAESLRRVRERRRWTQQDLADRLGELGAPTDRATIARTENNNRGLSLDDALLYALAVGAAPANMITITEDGGPIALAPKLSVMPVEARYWIRGSAILGGPLPLSGDDRTYATEVSDEEWVALQKYAMRGVIDDVQRLVNAVGARDATPEEKDTIGELIDRINASLEQLQRREVR